MESGAILGCGGRDFYCFASTAGICRTVVTFSVDEFCVASRFLVKVIVFRDRDNQDMNKIRLLLVSLLGLVIVGCSTTGGSGGENVALDKPIERSQQKYIPVDVIPLYTSDPLKVSVGPYSEKLMSNTPAEMKRLADEIKQTIDRTNIETLFVLAIRLYDLNLKDDAAYWYYTAQYRKSLFAYMLSDKRESLDNPGFELFTTLESLSKLSGVYINGYSFGDPDKLITTLEQVQADNHSMGYIGHIYPQLRFLSPMAQGDIIKTQEEGMADLIDAIRKNKESILQKRKENNVEGKY